MFCDVLFATAEYAAFATAVEAVTDTLRHKDLHFVAIEKAILSVNKRLRNITSVMQTRQASYAVTLA
jgi:hypothetical protein